jgi:hypothetical protein
MSAGTESDGERAETTARQKRPSRRVLVEVETPDSDSLVELLAGEFVAGLAILACKVIAEERQSAIEMMSEHHRYYEDDQQPRPARSGA